MAAENPARHAETVRLWSFTEDTLLEVDDEGSLVAITWWGEYEFRGTAAGVPESLARLALGPVSMANLVAADGAGEQAWRRSLLAVLARLSGSVVHSVALNDGRGPVLSAIPVTQSPAFRAGPLPAGRRVRLSRFTALRADGGVLLAETPGAPYKVALFRPPAILLASSLAAPTTVERLAAATGVAAPVVADVVEFLVAAGVVLLADAQDRFTEYGGPDTAPWSHEDLMFHARSRTWQMPSSREVDDGPPGPEPPMVKPGSGGPAFPLYRPEPAALAGRDPTLSALLETDHACPVVSDRGLSARQIGEFLFRAARVRSIGPAGLPGGRSHDATQRPYFSVACLYELEIYVGVNRCAGLARGIYHYDPLWHTLTLVNDDTAVLDGLLDMAMVAAGGHRRPPALLTMTARMSRVAWALGGAAYATTLLHLGALQQVFYLVAKAMGLAAHAVPADSGDRVDRALKLAWPAEVSVGECVLDFPPDGANST
ncbi:SagB family peptide dehydrogenase [Amycolatopsis vastitatis]|uniref:SagB-type dehydrogenase domain-containing protein n=1 Tax=Amycolatopsis vastitatis TaxID=1905142 RepID=A0A229SKY5_9PSEU|nr:SagB family peptide dehydrogenase [Amycolatopsis vastitatis]OXM59394.1 SagB-type dehydrogenase domain-containing protein [Amycolatopsis vastitatis]